MIKDYLIKLENDIKGLAKTVRFENDTHAYVQTKSGKTYSHVEMMMSASTDDQFSDLYGQLRTHILNEVTKRTKGQDFIFVWRTKPELFTRKYAAMNMTLDIEHILRVRFTTVPASEEIYNPIDH